MKKLNRLISVFSAVVLVCVFIVGLSPSSLASGWNAFVPTYSFPFFSSVFSSSSYVQVPSTAFTYDVSFLIDETPDYTIYGDIIRSVSYTITFPVSINFANNLDIGSFVIQNCRHNFNLSFSNTLGTGNGANYYLTSYDVSVADWNDLSYSTISQNPVSNGVSLSCYYNYIDILNAQSLTCVDTLTITLTYTLSQSLDMFDSIDSIDITYLRSNVPSFSYSLDSVNLWTNRYIQASEVTDLAIFDLLSSYVSEFNSFSSDSSSYLDIISDSVGRLPRRTVQGNPITIDDGAEDVPVSDFFVTFEPVQSGSGTPSLDNVRPITGYTSISVTQQGINDSDFFLLDWSSDVGLIYGGSVDILSGTIRRTLNSIILSDLTWHFNSTYNTYWASLPSASFLPTDYFALCSSFATSAPLYHSQIISSPLSNTVFLDRSNKRIVFHASDFADRSDFDEKIFNVQFVYKLAVPLLYDIEPIDDVATFLGDNTFSSSVGDMYITYSSNSTVLSLLSSIDDYLSSCSRLMSAAVDKLISLDVNTELIYDFLVSEFTGVNSSLFNLTQSQLAYLAELEVSFGNKEASSSDVLDDLTLDLPDIADIELDFDPYIDSGAFGSLTTFFKLFTADPIIGVFFAAIPICIFIGYVLHGKKV